MQSDIKLSILMPVYNQSAFVEESINSILSQSFQNWELMICDDGSSDDTYERVCRFDDSRIRIFRNLVNMGKVWTSNLLFKKLSGQLITVHDGDDISCPDRFKLQVVEFDKDPELVACGCSYSIINRKGKEIQFVEMPEKINPHCKDKINSGFIHGPTMVFRREAIDSELYRPFFEDYNEDVDLSFRLLHKGRIINLPFSHYFYRILPNSLSRRITQRKKIYFDLILELYNQRQQLGADWLMNDELDKVEDFIQQMIKKRYKDPLTFIEYRTGFLLYYKLNWEAIKSALSGIKEFPFRIKSFKILSYSLKRTFL